MDVFCCGSAENACCAKAKCGDSGPAPQPMAYPDYAAAEDRGDAGMLTTIDGCSNGKADCVTLGGKVVNGIQDASEGEETYEDGSSYKGQLLDGRRHGYGVWTSPTERFSGQWKNDHRDGQGRQMWQDERAQRMYEGQFKAGNFDGHGRMEWHTTNGLMIYEGQYLNDLKHGMGRYTWPDGRVYDGQWREGKRWGKATFTNSAGVRREGLWKEDKVERWIVESSANEDAGLDLRWDEERRDLHGPCDSTLA